MQSVSTAPVVTRVGIEVSEQSGQDCQTLRKALTPFQTASNGRAFLELVITAAPLALLWVVAIMLVRMEIWLGLILTVPAGGLLLRLFLIQHDCGHGSFFRRRSMNTLIGRSISLLTLTPYEDWRRSHGLHHATTGNLDRRGFGDIDTLTLEEYGRLSRTARWRYRLYRNPFVLFGIGPAYQFLIRHRVPANATRGGWRPWVSVAATNGAIAAWFAALAAIVDLGPLLLVQVPITLVAATAGIWLFYVQHQFTHATWARDGQWSFREAALRGSSHYDLPPVLRWFTANIGVHHVHHLCSTIPFYRMPEVLRSFPELTRSNRLGLRESLGTIRLALWHEAEGRLISFAEATRGGDH